MQNRIQRNEIHKDDAYFLDLAYKNKLNYYYIHNDTMYVAGTDNAQDVWDDITKVPKWGYLTDSARYKMVKPILDKNPQVKTLVGHSLAGTVVLRIQKEHPHRDYTVRTYGAPVFGYFGGKNTRYKHQFDPVSIFDMGAQITPVSSANPFVLHSYKGYTYDWDNHRLKPSDSTSGFYTHQTTQQGFSVGEPDIRAGLGAVGREGNTYRIY